MNRNILIIAFMLFSLVALGQTNNRTMDDKRQIENLYKQMYQAMIAKDIAVLFRII